MSTPEGTHQNRPQGEQESPRYQIQAAAFAPSTVESQTRGWSATQVLILLVTVLALFLIWFLFTAKSVRLAFSAPTQSVTLSGGFSLNLGEVFLLREGSYQLVAQAPDYVELTTAIDVDERRNQEFFFELIPTPGLLQLTVEPSSATVQIDDQQPMAAPQGGSSSLTLAAGEHRIELSHPRYQGTAEIVEIEGKGVQQQLSVTLLPNWSDVTMNSQPSGAMIYIDGESTGVATPGTVPALAGERLMELRRSGFKRYQQRLFAEAGTAVTLQTAALVQADAQLSLTSSPAGAAVSLDGKYLGDTPLELDLASKAGQRLLVLAKGYRAAREQLNLPTGKVSAKHIVLERLIGDLRLETRPSDALVRVNDEALDTLNGKQNLALPLQPYEVEVTREGYAGFTTTVYPIPGVEQTLRVKLLTLEEARLAAIRPEFTDKAGHLLRIQNADQVNMGASRREPGRRANETMRTASFERLFYLADREVTNAQFRAFASGHDSGKFDEISLNENDQPVTGISWHDAAAYCNWLSEQEKLEPFYEMEFAKVVAVNANALGYRLPTEAEWAWAARRLPPELSADGNQLRFAWGDSLPPPTRFENYADRSAANKIGRIIFAYNDNYTVAAPVGSYAANHRKLYDMGGNVAEWVHDYYEIPDDTAVNDSLGPTGGEYHVIRGASWMHGTITELRLSFRDYGIDGRQDLGFRVARYAE